MVINQTPLRISLAGGGTDIRKYYGQHGGEVIGFGIDKYLFVWIKERCDTQITVSWTKKEIVKRVEQIQHELVREAARMAGLTNGFEVTTTADIPSEGSGLGSSSALTVCLLNAFFQYRGAQLANVELAERACDIEIRILGRPIGKQDQYLSALGGIHHLRFHPDDKVGVERVSVCPETMRALNQNLLLFYTGMTRKAAQTLQGQISRMEDRLPLYHRMKGLVPQIRRALEQGQADDVGPILHEGWELKKQLSDGISLPEIDAMYEQARRGGATGGKLCGAGGGGFLLLYCPLKKQDSLREQLKAYAEMPFQIEPSGTRAIFNTLRPMWKVRP